MHLLSNLCHSDNKLQCLLFFSTITHSTGHTYIKHTQAYNIYMYTLRHTIYTCTHSGIQHIHVHTQAYNIYMYTLRHTTYTCTHSGIQYIHVHTQAYNIYMYRCCIGRTMSWVFIVFTSMSCNEIWFYTSTSSTFT